MAKQVRIDFFCRHAQRNIAQFAEELKPRDPKATSRTFEVKYCGGGTISHDHIITIPGNNQESTVLTSTIELFEPGEIKVTENG